MIRPNVEMVEWLGGRFGGSLCSKQSTMRLGEDQQGSEGSGDGIMDAASR